jgi:TonB family protein
MRGWAAGLLLLVAAGSAQAAPSEVTGSSLDLPVERTITNPDWAKIPDGNDMAVYYPQIAGTIGIGGRVVLHCAVTADGVLTACSATSETPVGMGFGDAAIAMAAKFQMRPATTDGRPVEGGQINIPIRFQPPNVVAATGATSADDGPPPDPKALALAVRLAQLMRWDESLAADEDRYASRLVGWTQQAGLTAQETAALDSLKAAAGERMRSQLSAREAAIARAFSPDQLQKLINLFADPAAQQWFSRLDAIQNSGAENTAASQARMMQDARKRFCEQVACIESADAPASK